MNAFKLIVDEWKEYPLDYEPECLSSTVTLPLALVPAFSSVPLPFFRSLT